MASTEELQDLQATQAVLQELHTQAVTPEDRAEIQAWKEEEQAHRKQVLGIGETATTKIIGYDGSLVTPIDAKDQKENGLPQAHWTQRKN